VTPRSPAGIRLIALDVDGTLIDRDGVLRPRTVRAVREAIAAGIRVALVTGRMTSSALPFARELGIREPIIGLQGAAVRELPADGATRLGRLLYHRPLDPATTRETVAWCRTVGLAPHLNILETMYFDGADERIDAWSQWLPGNVRIVPDVAAWARRPVSKVIAVGPPGLPAAVVAAGRALFVGRADAVVSHPEFLEFIAPGVSKGRALRWLARRHGIPLAATMAIGDQMNDLDMVAEAGVGVAMPHAPAELLAVAAIIAPPLAEEGAAQVIEAAVVAASRSCAGDPERGAHSAADSARMDRRAGSRRAPARREGGRMSASGTSRTAWAPLREVDPEVWAVMRAEAGRQHDKLELIASENYAFTAVMEAQGSWLTNKYAEGLPGRRYYAGCEWVDVVEELARERALALFPGAAHVNVQPHSGAQANQAAFFAVLSPGDRIMGMSLAHGGHLTHGSRANLSGRWFEVHAYGVEPGSERLDYDALERQAAEVRPKLIVVGASAYSRTFDFERLADIAHGVGAYLLADIAHIAGLVAGGVHPSPFPHADLVTTTTHKTLRGPRGGMVFASPELAGAIDKAVFPGIQGGPLMHVIAAKAVAFRLAATPEFQADQRRTVENAAALAAEVSRRGGRLVSGGTDNHLLMVDVRPFGVTGRDAERLLDRAGMTVNKNAIPFDTAPPTIASGIRLGTPAVTTRGLGPDEMRDIGRLLVTALTARDEPAATAAIAAEVRALCDRFPVPGLPGDGDIGGAAGG